MQNKTIIRTMAMAILATALILSCSKQQISSQDSLLNYKLPDDIGRHVMQQNGLLKFENKESFDRVFQILESENNRYSDILQEHCDNLAKQSSKSIEVFRSTEFAVYEAFEEALSFYSLRAKIVEEEREWLNNRELDIANDPDNHCIVGDEMRTLFNENGEIMIGKSIYKVGPNWLVYEITNGSFEILETLRETGLYEHGSLHIIIHNQENQKAGDCKLNQDKIEYENYAVNYRIKCRVTITNAVFWHYAKAELTHYKSDNNGGWDKYPSDLKIELRGPFRNQDCESPTQMSVDIDESNVKSTSVKRTFGATGKAKNGDIWSDNYVNDSFEKRIILAW